MSGTKALAQLTISIQLPRIFLNDLHHMRLQHLWLQFKEQRMSAEPRDCKTISLMQA